MTEGVTPAKWGCLFFYAQFRLRFPTDFFASQQQEQIINEGLITYSSNRKKQEDRIMKTAQYTKSLTVSLRPEVFDQIKQITDERQISIAEWIRDAVEAAFEKVK